MDRYERENQLVGQITDLQRQLRDAQATVEALQAQHKDLVLRNKILRDRPDLPAERCAFHDEVEALQRERDDLSARLEVVREHKRDLQAALDAEREKVTKLEAALDAAQDESTRWFRAARLQREKGQAIIKDTENMLNVATRSLREELSQLQALVRAYLEARKSIDSDLAEQARENLKRALDATTPATMGSNILEEDIGKAMMRSKGGDGE